MKTSLLQLSLLAALGTSAMAGVSPIPPMPQTPAFTGSLYNANEWQVDLSGSYSFSDSKNRRVIHDHAWGGDVDVNYFFTRNFGVGLEGSLFDGEGATLGSTALNLYQRFPIGDSPLAIYGFEGAGFTFNADNLDYNDVSKKADDVVFEGHAGLGVEYRFSHNFGIFSDARYTFENTRDSNFATVRTGVRLAF